MELGGMNRPTRLAPLMRYIYSISIALMEMYSYGENEWHIWFAWAWSPHWHWMPDLIIHRVLQLNIVLTPYNIMFGDDYSVQLLLDCFDDHTYLGLPLVMELGGMNRPTRLVPLMRYICPMSIALMEMCSYGDNEWHIWFAWAWPPHCQEASDLIIKGFSLLFLLIMIKLLHLMLMTIIIS